MDTPKTVEVRLAFVFNCEACGQENFVHAVMHEFTPDERADAVEELGERPKTGEWVTHPERVVCSKCHAEFRAINPGEVADEIESRGGGSPRRDT